MKKYEVVIILDPRVVEGNGDAFSDAFQASMKEMGGNVTRVKFFEQRTFAYPIRKRKTGIYWDYVVEAEGTFVAELKDKYRLNQSVLRLVVFEYEDGQDDDVFNTREEHDKLIKEDNFQDAFDFDERPYRGRD
ncbi:MAG: 30S ribosomal protein S6 [Victivallales bacterium]|nr:30S ribosomal protein S6 [Victivallales bacterium]